MCLWVIVILYVRFDLEIMDVVSFEILFDFEMSCVNCMILMFMCLDSI